MHGIQPAPALAATSIVFVALLSWACDPGAGITWINETDQSVDIYFGEGGDDFALTVPPQTSQTVGTIEAVWADVVVVRDSDGTVLFREELTWEELEAQGFRFVISEGDLAPGLGGSD